MPHYPGMPYVLVPVSGDDVSLRRPEPLDFADVNLVLVQVGHVLGNVELRNSDLVQCLAELARVQHEKLDRTRHVGEAFLEVVEREIVGLMRRKRLLFPSKFWLIFRSFTRWSIPRELNNF